MTTSEPTTDLTAEERASLGLPAVPALRFDAAAWRNNKAPEWRALRELAETDPVSAENIRNLWKAEAAPRLQTVAFRGRTIRQVLADKWVIDGWTGHSGFPLLDRAKRSLERVDHVRNA